MRSLTLRGVSSRTSAAAIFAAASVATALWLSLQPERLNDFARVTHWLRLWLEGHDVYTSGLTIDYPPWALVVFSPLAVVPTGVAVPVWVALNLLMLVAASWRLSEERPPNERFLVTCLLVAAGAGRTLNQFSLFAFMAGVFSLRGSRLVTTLWLGVACVKPQIALVFLILAALEGAWIRATAAVIVPMLLSVVYAARVHTPLTALPASVLAALFSEYGLMPPGRTEITPWVMAAVPIGTATAICLVLVITLAPLVWMRAGPARRLVAALGSLLAIRQLSYDLLLLLPWAATLDVAGLWVVSALCVCDPSAAISRLWPHAWLAVHADRLVLLSSWIVVVWLSTWKRAINQTRYDKIRH